ncbi:MAG: alanine--tRNA ligase, partial [Gemmatimonadales bacterium]
MSSALSASQIREAFLKFFEERGHRRVASSSLVPQNDPTLLFTNAGMVQFKDVFTGREKRDYSRATTSQKCVRAGGKHNDLDNVGYTARHHTFFEMLGNFSFGDYFKADAIAYGWEFVTKTLGLPVERLAVTVFNGEGGIPWDEEAFELWAKQGVPRERIYKLGYKDNFWAMGDTGPCGPCSEVHFHQGDDIPCAEVAAGRKCQGVACDCDRWLEIWNLVFMQFERKEKDAPLIPLPKPSIDTGAGLERIASVVQGKRSNYDTDLFQGILGKVSELAGKPYTQEGGASMRVVADHGRAAAFLISDGVQPSNEGRGYVLRRIMRRAMRHAQLLGARDPIMYRLVPALVREMGQAYPELIRAEPLITETLRLEESRFRKTLERGLSILDEETRTLREGQNLSGEVAFTLYDTFGFPLDLTQDALKSRGIGVDTDAFGAAMERQREKARAAWSGSGDAATETVWFGIRERVGATEFLGYDTEIAEGVVLATLKDGAERGDLQAGESGLVVLNQTPFYGESGGQVGDTGIMKGDGVRVRVTATEKKLGDLIVHHVLVEHGTLRAGQSLELIVDHERRSAVRANHSATHLLHEALRQVLGGHVAQKGSLVAPDRLRFDFSHPKPIDDGELQQVEAIANKVLLQNEPVVTRLMAVDEAIESGARALFGEKYGDEVRVVAMGKGDGNKAFSVELCGGTHVNRTGDIGVIAVVSEGAVAAGVRRMEAMTGDAARRHLTAESRKLHEIAGLLKTPVED